MKQLVKFFAGRARDRFNHSDRRPLRTEALEKRQLLAGDLLVAHNYAIPEDVNGDWKITPLDALLVLNHISANGSQSNLSTMQAGEVDYFLDVTATDDVTPLDALRVLNRIATGEAVGELLQLEINPRTATDTAFDASAFNPATRELMVGVDEVFLLEVLYRDLRGPFNRTGAFAIYTDVLFDQLGAGNLQPVLTETQTLQFSASIKQASSGTIEFEFTGRPGKVIVDFNDFAASADAPAQEIQQAIETLGFSDVTVQALSGGPEDPLNYLIRFNDFALADQDLPNLIVTSRLDVAVTTLVRDVKPRLTDGSINNAAVPLNLNFDSRTMRDPRDVAKGDSFFGFAGTQVGTFEAATGFFDVGATGPLLINGWSDMGLGGLPIPFDSFSIPVKLTENTSNLRVYLDPPNTTATLNLFYGRDTPIPNDLVLIDLNNDPAVATDGTGLLLITATGGQVVTVEAADETLDAVQNGPAVQINLRDLVTVSSGATPLITITTPPTKGTFSLSGAGVLTYTPAAGQVGADSFVYTATVGGISDTGTISVDIAPEQVRVTANNGSLTAFQNGLPVPIDLKTLVSVTPAGTQFTFELIGEAPAFGSASLGANGVVTYTPPASQSGATSFRYRVTSVGDDPQSAEATVNVTVNQEITINADDASFDSVQAGPPILITLFPNGLVQTSGTGTTPQITLNTIGTKGTVSFNNGVLTYTPPANRFDVDSFSYTASIAPIAPGFAGVSDSGVITINQLSTITAQDSLLTKLAGDPPSTINLLSLVATTGTDDQPTFTLDTTGLLGSAVLNGNQVTYTPPATEFGTTSFEYTATVDGKSATATITISEGVSIEARPGTLVAYPGGPAASLNLNGLITVTGSDAAPTFGLASNPSVGTAQVNPTTGVLTYTPAASGAFGQLTFNYRVTVEDVTTTGTITVTELTVNAPDRTLAAAETPPGGTPQPVSLTLNASVSVDLPPSFSIVQGPNLGTATVVGNQLTYTPKAFDFNQTTFTDTIVYRATVNGVSDSGTIAITITPVILPPVANDDAFRVTANVPTTFLASRLTGNDVPARPLSGNPVEVTSFDATTTQGGTIIRNANGSFTYTPPVGLEEGSDSFQYTITSNGLTSTATATLTVSPFLPSTISGSIFTDYIQSIENPVRNRIRDANEPAVGGVSVILTSPATSNLLGQNISILALTDADGEYAFRDLAPGEYTVRFDVPNVLLFGTRVDTNGVSSGGVGASFRVNIGQDGGLQAGGLNFTVLGRTGNATGSGSILVSDYLLANPNSPQNINNPEFGLATMIVNPSGGEQQVFELTKGFDNVHFAEIAVDASGSTALLTLIMGDGSVRTYFLSRDNGDFIISSNRSVVKVLKNLNSMTPLELIQDQSFALEAYGNYRNLVDHVLGQGPIIA